jgi:hypothetical protein
MQRKEEIGHRRQDSRSSPTWKADTNIHVTGPTRARDPRLSLPGGRCRRAFRVRGRTETDEPTLVQTEKSQSEEKVADS